MSRETHAHQRDPAVIREWARRMRNVRRGWIVCASALGTTFAISALASVLMSELGRIVTIVVAFTAAAIVFLIMIPIINSNYNCPACGEYPILPKYEVSWFDEGNDLPFVESIAACESCGAALK